jgi:arylsulfatase A
LVLGRLFSSALAMKNINSCRRIITPWLVILLAVAALTVHANESPNFVVILCDDLGYGDLSNYGHPSIKTPNLDRLAANGIRFTSCYSAAPVCSPSRAGLLTGRIPNRAGIYDWIPSGKQARPDAREQVHLQASEITLPQLLKENGYATCLTGKYHCNSLFNDPSQAQPGDLGFDHWFATQNNAAPSHQNPKNFVRNGTAVGPLQGFSCQLVVDEGIRWLEDQEQIDDDKPFFMLAAFHEPHEPVASPKELTDLYLSSARSKEEAEYFANVANVDLAVGRLISRLEELGEADRTLVIFTSDNGPETLNRYGGASRSYGQATPLRGMKLWTTEAGFRVPGIAYWPGTILPGQTIHDPVSSLDLLPTFASLADIPLPNNAAFDGTDISALLQGDQVNRKQPLFWCFFNALNGQQVAMRTTEWKVIATLDNGKLEPQQNVHDGNIAQIRGARLSNVEFYRINEDIGETENLAKINPAMAAELKQQLRLLYEELTASSHYWIRQQ